MEKYRYLTRRARTLPFQQTHKQKSPKVSRHRTRRITQNSINFGRQVKSILRIDWLPFYKTLTHAVHMLLRLNVIVIIKIIIECLLCASKHWDMKEPEIDLYYQKKIVIKSDAKGGWQGRVERTFNWHSTLLGFSLFEIWTCNQ